ncbi:DNA-binding domain-containing protein [Rhizobium sp. RU36D]|uniref:HvfC/BufC N-terminal domain-containing protein n=1 Tax=Rhizobium sp. RU36D TaxID=1907415 RepID=UPI0009D8772D|nr:DNA-binding domain-containing protein [Rhizobium sp. RU36D]SMC99448.1 Putative DNA-binding domain-containing protein [Rhizobium sp. RU36D]
MTMGFVTSQNAFAAALIDPERPPPPGLTTARGEPDALRFAVYRNNVHVGLTTALAQRFPVTRRLVGEEFFTGMARAYAGQHKPASPLLMAYGDGFPDFIAVFPPAASLAYLADVARLEVAWGQAYHAADCAPLDLSALATVPADSLADAGLELHPSARLLRSDHPAGSIWAAHQGGTVEPVHDWVSETVLVVRPEMHVQVHILPPRDTAFAAALFAGVTLGAAAEAAYAANHDFDFGSALVGLIGLGAFCAVKIP